MAYPKKPCGSVAAYRRHRTAGEEACAPCKRAYAEWARQREETRVPPRPCPGCGKKIRSARLCRECVETIEVALYAGEWVVRRGIKVWVPWADAA